MSRDITDKEKHILYWARGMLEAANERLGRVDDGIFRMLLGVEHRPYAVQAINAALDYLEKCRTFLLQLPPGESSGR